MNEFDAHRRHLNLVILVLVTQFQIQCLHHALDGVLGGTVGRLDIILLTRLQPVLSEHF